MRGRRTAPAILASLLTALTAPAAPVAAEEAAPAKTSNIGAPSLAAEPGAFLKAALERPAAGRCEVLSPDPGFVKEMLLDISSIGSPGGRKYERRVALVVGNGAYRTAKPLPNPPNDATSMAKMFRALGFTVYRAIDATEPSLDDCFAKFKGDLEASDAGGAKADIALFFYAGHGVQLTSAMDNEKRNYMLSVDAAVDPASGKAKGFRQIDRVLTEMRAHSKQAVFLYDACRNAPYGEGVVKEADGQSVRQIALEGAAPVAEESDRASQAGLFIAYATSPGKTADDSWGPQGSTHSPFTEALLKNLPTPGKEIGEALVAAYFDVARLTRDENGRGRQTPWTSSSLQEELRLNGGRSLAEVEIASRDFAARSAAEQSAGLKWRALTEALKGGLQRSRDAASARAFAAARTELYRAMRADVVLQSRHYNETGIGHAVFTADGAAVYAVGVRHQRETALYEATTGRAISGSFGDRHWEAAAVAVRPDGKQLALIRSIGVGGVLMNPVAIKGRALSPSGAYGGLLNVGVIRSFAYSRDSRHFVTSDYIAPRADIWNAETGAKEASLVDRHSAVVHSAAFSEDGKWVITVSADKTARVWNTATGEQTRVFVHTTALHSAAFSPSGPGLRAALGDDAGDILIWNVESGAVERVLKHPRTNDTPVVDAIAWRPDGKLLAAASQTGKSFAVWDADNGVEILKASNTRYDGELGSYISFSPDGRRLLAGGGAELIRKGDSYAVAAPARIIDLHEIPILSISAHSTPVNRAILSRDGTLAAAASEDGSVTTWDAATGARGRRIEVGRPVRDVAFNTSGSRIVTALSNGTAALFDLKTGAKLRTVTGHVDSRPVGRDGPSVLNTAQFSADDERIITAGADGTARIWGAATGAAGPVLSHGGPVFVAGFIGDGARVFTVSAGDGGAVLRFWDARNGAEILDETPVADGEWSCRYGVKATVSPDGAFVFTGNWSEGPAAKLCRYEDPDGLLFESYVDDDHNNGQPYRQTEVFSTDGRLLAARFGVLRDAATAEILNPKRIPMEDQINYAAPRLLSAAFSGDGSKVITASSDGIVKIWDVGLYGPALRDKALALLSDEERAEIERERLRYWEIDPALLQ